MKRVISTNVSLQSKAECLRSAGITHAVRYYSKPGSDKAIKPAEANALAAAGIGLAVVYQERARSIGDFTRANAISHAKNALKSAAAIGQPAGSAIYFAVDYDATPGDLQGAILSYFNQIEITMAGESGGRNPFHLGVYGSGRSCKYLKSNCPAVRYTWLSVSKGWADSRTYNGWDLNQVWGEGNLCGLTPVFVSGNQLHDGDYEYNDDDGEFGAFTPGQATAAIVIAPQRDGAPFEAASVESAEFTMELGTGGNLRTGTLSLKGRGRKVLFSAEAVTGRAGHQDLSNIWEQGQGPLPPQSDYKLETLAELPESNGQLGVRFAITPSPVRSSTGVSRGGFSIHGPEPAPGSNGGIALLHENDYSQLRRILAGVLAEGVEELPLKIAYSGGVADFSARSVKKFGAVFSMQLRKTSTMLYGTFVISDEDGEELYSGRATSGLAGHQHPDAFWEVGKGVVPPSADDRFIMTEIWATDPPMGTRYQITPEKVWNAAHTHSRTAFRVHFDGGVPGSAGCIVTPSRSDYDRIIALFAALKARDVTRIPLTLNYT